MNTLSITDIFKNLAFYQAHYQSILSDSNQYHTLVEDAVLSVWPLSSKNLYLGDLLQLWFSQKWRVDQTLNTQNNKIFREVIHTANQDDELYLYHIEGNALLGRGVAKGWSISEQCAYEVTLESSLQYYCTYKFVA